MSLKKKTKYTPKTASFLRRDLNARQKTKEFLLKFQVPNSEVLDGQVIIYLSSHPCAQGYLDFRWIIFFIIFIQTYRESTLVRM